MQTMNRVEALDAVQCLVDCYRDTMGDLGQRVAERAGEPHGAEIGAKVQRAVDLLILETEVSLLQAIRDLPTVGASDGR